MSAVFQTASGRIWGGLVVVDHTDHLCLWTSISCRFLRVWDTWNVLCTFRMLKHEGYFSVAFWLSQDVEGLFHETVSFERTAQTCAKFIVWCLGRSFLKFVMNSAGNYDINIGPRILNFKRQVKSNLPFAGITGVLIGAWGSVVVKALRY